MNPTAAEQRAHSVCCGIYGDPAYGFWKAEAHEYKRQLIEKYLNEKPEERRMCAVDGCQFAASFGEGGTLCYRHYRSTQVRETASPVLAGEPAIKPRASAPQRNLEVA